MPFFFFFCQKYLSQWKLFWETLSLTKKSSNSLKLYIKKIFFSENNFLRNEGAPVDAFSISNFDFNTDSC